MRYLRLIKTFIRSALQTYLAFRFDFFMSVVGSLLGLLGGLTGLYVLFANGETLQGWTFPQTLAVLGVYTLVLGINSLVVQPSLDALSGMGGEIERGTFDFTLLKPVRTQLYVSTRVWSPAALVNVAVGIVITIVAAGQMRMAMDAGRILRFLLSLCIAQALLYAVLLLLSAVSFWYRGTYLLWIVGDVLQTGRYPVGIYPGFLRTLLTWVVPIGFIITVPAEVLSGQAGWTALLMGALLAAVFWVSASAFFRASLRRYSSASS